MASNPQLLVLVHRVPYPPNRGDRIRTFHILKFLAQRADVHLAFCASEPVPDDTIQTLQRMCVRVAAAPLGKGRWVNAAWSLAAGRTATEGLFRSCRMRRVVESWAAQTHFDAAVVFCSSMVQYLAVPGLANVPAIVDLIDVDSQKWSDYAQHARRPLRWAFQVESSRLRRLEASLSEQIAAVAVVSHQEAELFRSFCPSDRVHVVLNGVDLDYFRSHGDRDASGSADCVFVGALDYRANLDGVAWFCRHVWNGVRMLHPKVTFRLVGSRPGAAARELARLPGVEMVGEVPDVRPYLRDAAVAVVPLRVARGIQNKVLEALAMGTPVVASPQALEGIGTKPDVHVCQAATPDEWVQAVGALLSDAELRNRLALAGRDFVEQHFRWEARLDPLAQVPGLSRCIERATLSPEATVTK